MRVYVSVDMEGIAGVVHESQTDPTNPVFASEYGRFRRLMTAEANAAVDGALAAGATKIVVNDSHWFMRNLLAEELNPAAELVSGDPKPRSMVQGIEASFDAALFIGYHARAGTGNAILDHTYADRIHEVRLNGKPVGELGINAAFAGIHGVPVALVSGDAALASPITLEVDFALTVHADMAALCPGAVRSAGRTVCFTHEDYREVFRAWRAMLNLSGVA
jgi:D-amino peptidase